MGLDSDIRFVNSVVYFWDEKRDPTRYCFWDAERCRQLMPAFYEAWRQCKAYEQLADLAARAAYKEED